MATPSAAPNSFTSLLAPDIAAQQVQVARQQQFADALRQQAMAADPGTQSVGGMAIARSPWENIAKVFSGGLGGVLQKNADDQNLQLAQALKDKLSPLFGGTTATTQTDPSTSALAAGASAQPNVQDADGSVTNAGGVGPTTTNSNLMTAMQSQPQVAQPSQSGSGPLGIPGVNPAAAMWAFTSAPNEYAAALLKRSELTELQKNNAYSGVTAQEQGEATRRKLIKDGLIDAREGSTIIDPITGQRTTVAKEGIQINYDRFGNPVASAVPGWAKAYGGNAAAKQSAINEVTPASPDESIYYGDGSRMPTTKAQYIAAANAAHPTATATQTGNPVAQPLMPSGAPGQLNPNLPGANIPSVAPLGLPMPGQPAPQMAPQAAPQPVSAPMGVGRPAALDANANSAANNAQDVAKKSFTNLSDANTKSQATIQNLQHMIQIGQSRMDINRGLLSMADMSSDHAEYDKLQAGAVKDMAASAGAATNSGRDLLSVAVPEYSVPKPAQKAGLTNLMNQAQVTQLKAKFLTPVFNSGNAQQYNALENQFDQHVTPGLAGAISVPDPNSRKAAVADYVKSHPDARTGVKWALENGLLQ